MSPLTIGIAVAAVVLLLLLLRMVFKPTGPGYIPTVDAPIADPASPTSGSTVSWTVNGTCEASDTVRVIAYNEATCATKSGDVDAGASAVSPIAPTGVGAASSAQAVKVTTVLHPSASGKTIYFRAEADNTKAQSGVAKLTIS